MLSYQHAYAAAGRLVTAIDEMLDQLINRMGIVGR
jgi:flagellar hook-associated protein 1